MGSVVKFPGKTKDDLNELKLEDADILSICPMDTDFVPLYEEEFPDFCWWGVSAFWHVNDELTIKLVALFKDKRDAVLYAVSKNPNVEPDMPRDTLTELRTAILTGKGEEPEDDTRH